jgi:predicted SAM-dependent methyltransferase
LVKLNIGCGPHYAEGWTNMELPEAMEYHADLRGDVRDLASAGFADGSVDRVYMGHVIEHIPLPYVVDALKEVRRVLAPEGRVMIVGPDANLCKSYDELIGCAVACGSDQSHREGGPHLWVPTLGLMIALLRRAQFDYRDTDIRWVTNDWPVVSRAHWQFAVEGWPADLDLLSTTAEPNVEGPVA